MQGRFDQKHLQAIHHFIFQDVYDWAGKLRTVDIAKGGHLFALPQFIQASLTAFFTNLKSEAHLRHLAQNLFIGRSAHYFGELTAIHPFREGNGRSQREFFRELALHAGYVIK